MSGFDIKMTDNSPQYLAALHERIGVALEAVAIQAKNHAEGIIERAHRKDTGWMLQHIDYSVSGNSAYIGTNVEYAIWHEIGTGIYASQGGGRQTPWLYKDRKGETHITRGVKPLHFLKRSIQEHDGEYKAIIEKVMKG